MQNSTIQILTDVFCKYIILLSIFIVNVKLREVMVLMTIGQRIQVLRKSKGLTQEQLANEVNISRQAVAKWETDVCQPNLDCLTQMSNLFKVSLDYLITGAESEYSKEQIQNIITTEKIFNKKKDIVLITVFILSALVFIGLFFYSLFEPLYMYQHYSFIWWYICVWTSTGLWFRIIVLLSVISMIFSLRLFLKRKK